MLCCALLNISEATVVLNIHEHYAAESRGQAGPALLAYTQRFGKPHKLVHDNAQEFIHGEFHDILYVYNKASNKYPLLLTLTTLTKTLWNSICYNMDIYNI
jgi:hypothetical protein